jgi:N-acylneuraminate cytidylyltransferase
VRESSRSFPPAAAPRAYAGKNLRRVGGRSLVERAVDACRAARLVEAVYVSTDDAEIAARAEAARGKVIMRPAELSGDTASSESALLHALDQLSLVGDEPEVLAFVQCTSPFIASDDLDRGVEMIIHDLCRLGLLRRTSYDFLWRADDGFGLVTGQNHNPAYDSAGRSERPTSARPALSMSCQQQGSRLPGIAFSVVRQLYRCPS